jgi:argininosuccinate synthase
VKKVVHAYSGGLDTFVILRWLQGTCRCEVVTFTADLGQGGHLLRARLQHQGHPALGANGSSARALASSNETIARPAH